MTPKQNGERAAYIVFGIIAVIVMLTFWILFFGNNGYKG